MICPSKEILLAWIDKELPVSEIETISAHVEKCTDCENYILAQKKMETVWRNAWVDPDESDFKTMRSSIEPATQWWRRQQTWFLAAVICAAYIGVKIFYVDEETRSLSSIVIEQTISATHEDLVDDVEPVIQEESEETVVSEETENMDDIVEGQISDVSSEHSEVLVIEDESMTEHYSDSEGDLPVDIAGINSDVSFASTESSPAVVQVAVQDELCFAAGTSNLPPSGGAVGTGGGGSGDSGIGGLPTQESENDVQRVYESPCEAILSVTYTVSIVQQSKETYVIQRSDWDSLFSIIDSLLAEKSYLAGESLVLGINSDGFISGDETLDGVLIGIPRTSYENCSVIVYFR